ncbi:MAG: GGDEF domain-containing protein [bacterium]
MINKDFFKNKYLIIIFILFSILSLLLMVKFSFPLTLIITTILIWISSLLNLCLVKNVENKFLKLSLICFYLNFFLPYIIFQTSFSLITISVIQTGIITASFFLLCISIYKMNQLHQEKEENMKFLSFHDYLTGVYNRHYFENEINRLKQSRLYPISLIFVDIDNLKKINDLYGHTCGDKIIKQVAKILLNATRQEDIISRIGGDEFVILLPKTDSLISKQICNRIHNMCQKYSNKVQHTVSVSVGTATTFNKELKLTELMKKADHNMYYNKHNKKKMLLQKKTKLNKNSFNA